MSPEMTGGSFVWVCPACSRRVPNRVVLCRCGYEAGAEVESPSPAAPLAEVSPPRQQVPWALIWSGISMALLAVLVVQWSSSDTTRPGAPSSAVSLETSEAQAAATPLRFAPAVVPTEQPPAAPMPEVRVPSVSSRRPAFAAAPPALEDVIGAAIPAIVSIESPAGRGTGFFVAPGVVVTNEHVISGNWNVMLKSAGVSMRARVTKLAPEFDLALLRVDNPVGQAILPLGTATTARVGQEVIAIGFALGLLENTVTRGIISGIRTAGSATFVQTDAAINPGNSGGPLLDRNGRVIGIATLKFGDSAESLGFAIAVDHLKPLLYGSAAALPRPAPSASTNRALSSLLERSTPSGADRRRAAGQADFEQALAAIAARADQIDDFWQRYTASCLGGQRLSGTYDREWFRVYENRVPEGRAAPGCAQWLSDVNELADGIRSAMKEVDQAARRLDVYPGVRRDLRRQYRLDWRGWK